jgi:hypothetical protein
MEEMTQGMVQSAAIMLHDINTDADALIVLNCIDLLFTRGVRNNCMASIWTDMTRKYYLLLFTFLLLFIIIIFLFSFFYTRSKKSSAILILEVWGALHTIFKGFRWSGFRIFVHKQGRVYLGQNAPGDIWDRMYLKQK